MAEMTISNRNVGSSGALKIETGEFEGNVDGHLKTKLGRIISFRMFGTANGDHDAAFYINSITASTTQDDPGNIYITGTSLNASTYCYNAQGVG